MLNQWRVETVDEARINSDAEVWDETFVMGDEGEDPGPAQAHADTRRKEGADGSANEVPWEWWRDSDGGEG